MTSTPAFNFFNQTPRALQAFCKARGLPGYRAQQWIKWVYQRGVTDFHAMTDLPAALRQELSETMTFELPRVITEKVAECNTRKWLLALPEGNAIEMVFIPDDKRGTLCVSSQVGCALNCSFCATGKEGFNRNLTFAEIIGQVWLARHQLIPPAEKLTNVVMMGMGEPLLNYDPVVAAMNVMMDDSAFGLSKYRVTLSTAGVVPQMEQLKKDSECSLAVSLHAATNALRNELVPLNKKYPLEVLMSVCRDYFPKGSRRHVMFEYVLLEGVNDRPEDAKALIRLLNSMPVKVNLIPFNSFQGTQYTTPSDERVYAFQRWLVQAGIRTFLRKTRGRDQEGACGQLAGQFKDRTGRHQRWLKTGRLVVVS